MTKKEYMKYHCVDRTAEAADQELDAWIRGEGMRTKKNYMKARLLRREAKNARAAEKAWSKKIAAADEADIDYAGPNGELRCRVEI